jgi:predicted ATPase
MKVLNLSLANYRGFEQIDITFEPDVTVIAGVNGVGKSGVMDALLTLISHTQQLHGLVKKGNSYEPQDIRIGQNNLSTEATFDLGDSSYKTTAYRGYSGTELEKKAEANLKRVRTELQNKELSAEERKELKEKERFIKESLSVNRTTAFAAEIKYSPVNQTKANRIPLGIFFSPDRNQFVGIYGSKKEAMLGTSSAFQDALERRPVKLTPFLHWFRQRQKLEDPTGSRRKVLPVMIKAVESFLPGFSKLRLDESPRPRFTIDKGKERLELYQLSDGERSLLAMVMDLSRRLSLAYPDLDDPLKKGEAIVLIDEIELHLHPSWERKVLRQLHNTFPSVQFVVTTHSPQVLGEVEGRCIRHIRPLGQGKFEITGVRGKSGIRFFRAGRLEPRAAVLSLKKEAPLRKMPCGIGLFRGTEGGNGAMPCRGRTGNGPDPRKCPSAGG